MKTFLIASLILSVLEMAVVAPLTAFRLRRRLAADGVPADPSVGATLESSVYIRTDVAVLAVAGLIAGLFGHWFIGISLRRRGWPGMLSFMVSSFVAFFFVLLAKGV